MDICETVPQDTSSIEISSELSQKAEDDLSEWNYEYDLELLKLRLSSATGNDQRKIRDLIKSALKRTEGLNAESSQEIGPEKLSFDPFRTDANLTSGLIEQTRYLFSQFHTYYRDREFMQESLSNESIRESEMSTKTSNANAYSSLGGSITREGLNKVLTSFQSFFTSVLMSTQKSPFEVDLTLDAILKFLPRNELLNCRLINSFCNKQAVYLFCEEPSYVCRVKNMKKFCEDIELTKPFIFKKVEISLELSNLEDDIAFFSKFGPEIKHITINENLEDSDEDSDDDSESDDGPFKYQTSLRNMFQNIPNLKSLSLVDLPQTVVSQPFVLTGHELKTIRLLNVKTLEITSSVVMDIEFLQGIISLVSNASKVSIVGDDYFFLELKLAKAISKLNLTVSDTDTPHPTLAM